jgi:hypothetical protein
LAHTGTITASDKINIGFDSFSSTAARRTMAQISALNENPASGNPGSLLFYTNVGAASLTEKMRIDSAGNVGIGTASPSANGLEISKTAESNSGVKITSGTQSAEIVVNSGAGLYVTNNSTTLPTMFWTNSAERLRIASAGQIGIGGANYGTSGQALVSNGALAAPSWQSVSTITRATALAYNWNGLTTNTFLDFISIPSWVKRITVMLNGVSLSGASETLVQIGSTTFSTSGYNSISNETNQANSTAGASSTAGFVLKSGLASQLLTGIVTIANLSSNTWVSSHALRKSATNACYGGGDGSTSGTLDRIRITSANGTDTFDAGTVNIMYE